MSIRTGLFRIAIVVRVGGAVLGALCVLGGIGGAIAYDGERVGMVITGMIGAVFFAGGGYLIAWLIEGFAPD